MVPISVDVPLLPLHLRAPPQAVMKIVLNTTNKMNADLMFMIECLLIL